jgi:hypothetical protein
MMGSRRIGGVPQNVRWSLIFGAWRRQPREVSSFFVGVEEHAEAYVLAAGLVRVDGCDRSWRRGDVDHCQYH